jgi:hypothetical protein
VVVWQKQPTMSVQLVVACPCIQRSCPTPHLGGTWQTPLLQMPLRQSLSVEQPCPSKQDEQDPPQSTSVSSPFLTPSLQTGTEQAPPSQTPLTQSVFDLQVLPFGHLSQEPPQSTSVSVPFWTPSTQLGTVHVPPPQTPLTQSVALPHDFSSGHLGQDPPQSTSVSSPFLTLSSQAPSDVGVQTPLSHVPLAHVLVSSGLQRRFQHC